MGFNAGLYELGDRDAISPYPLSHVGEGIGSGYNRDFAADGIIDIATAGDDAGCDERQQEER